MLDQRPGNGECDPGEHEVDGDRLPEETLVDFAQQSLKAFHEPPLSCGLPLPSAVRYGGR